LVEAQTFGSVAVHFEDEPYALIEAGAELVLVRERRQVIRPCPPSPTYWPDAELRCMFDLSPAGATISPGRSAPLERPTMDAIEQQTFDHEPSRREFLGASLALIVGATASADPVGAQPRTVQRGAPPPRSGSTLRFFPGFEPLRVTTSETEINGVVGGSGPPLLLLHGYPQSHLEWHLIAPALAEHFTIVATDLRGYGDSGKPPDGDDHEGYSKRAMALDQIEVMRHLGFDRFALVGHDRGARVAHRLTLDHPGAVSRLAVLDIVPTRHVFANVTRELATSYYHWFFMLRPAPFPETLYGTNADFVLRRGFFGGMIGRGISEEVYAEYLRCFSDPATQHAMCEDYRAAAGIDLVHDEADRGRTIECPLLAIWGANGLVNRLYDVLDVWREYAGDVRGRALPGGHWLPEQLPDETLGELLAFLRA
jgi:haloacetate dehalogenase